MVYELIFNIISVIGYIVSAIFFFSGLKVMVNYTKSDGDEAALFKKRSITLLAIACGCYAIGKLCSNFIPMSNQDYNLLEIILQSVVEAVLQTGFLVLLPVVIKGKRNRGNSK